MATLEKKIKVLIVDDSAVIRSVLTEILSSDPQIDVVGGATDPYDAREKIKKLHPDVLTLDIEMPKMNGIEFLKNLMRLHPIPVVMISTLTHEGAPATLEALAIGAIDFIGKPQNQGAGAIANYSAVIIEKVLSAARSNVFAHEEKPTIEAKTSRKILHKKKKLKAGFICAIGASTGGTEAIKDVITSLPFHSPPIVIAQHIPAVFSASFAQRVNAISELNVCEATHGQKIEGGGVYIAPGNSHLTIKLKGGYYYCELSESEPVNRHRPSVEVLFDSVLQTAGKMALGILLTGMGTDGAHALLRMRESGCMTIAQDEPSSVVWGMPGSAVGLNAACSVLPLRKIPLCIIEQAFR